MSKVLYIIGNGFDLHYGLETGVNTFKNILSQKYIDTVGINAERQRKIGKIDVYYKELNYSIDKIAEILHISSDEVDDVINSLLEENDNI